MSRIITQSFEGGHFYRFSGSLGLNGVATVITAASVPIPELDGSRVMSCGPFDPTRSIPLVLNGSGAVVTPTELFAGFFFLHSDPSNSVIAPVGGSAVIAKHRLMSFWSGGTGICTLHIDPITAKLELLLGALYWIDVFFNAVGSTSLTSLAVSNQGAIFIANTVYHVQIRVKLDGASSIVQVKLNDTLVIDWTGTLPGTTMDRVMTHGAGATYADSNGNLYYGTMIINDTTADTCGNDTWPGIARLKLQTISGPGTYSQFTPDPVQANYLNVQEVPNDGGTTTNYALSSGLKDSFPVSPQGLAASQVTYRAWFEEVIAAKTGGTFQIELGVRRAGVDYMSGVPLPLGVSFDVFDSYRCTDPSSLVAWDSAGLDATEIIYESS